MWRPGHLPEDPAVDVVLEDLAPGATRKVEVQLGGPSGLTGLVRWIGTTSPLKVTVSLAGSALATTGTT